MDDLIPNTTYLSPEDFDRLMEELERPGVVCEALRRVLDGHRTLSVHRIEDVLEELGIDVSDE